MFMKGKINILGASCSEQTKKLCNILYEIIKTNYDTIIVPEGEKWQTWRYNIDPLDSSVDYTMQDEQSACDTASDKMIGEPSVTSYDCRPTGIVNEWADLFDLGF